MQPSTTTLSLALLPTLLLSSLNAQEDRRSTLTVTPAGVFAQNQTRPGQTPPLPQPLQPSPQGLRWTWQSPASAAWIATSVSAGLRGSLAWVGHTLNGPKISLTATSDDTAPAPLPIYEVSYTGNMTVAAADRDSHSVVAHGAGVLEYWSAYSNTPVHTVTVPTKNGVAPQPAITADGRYYAAGFTTGTDGTEIRVYDAQSATPTTPIATLSVAPAGGGSTFNALRHFELSGDGSTVLVATHTTNYVFDVATSTELMNDGSTVSHNAHSISDDGKIWARGGFDLGAWVHNGTGYTRVLSGKGNSALGFPVWNAADISADGSTFALAAYDAQNSNAIEVTVFSLKLSGATRLWTYSHTGSGTFQNSPSAVSVSDDGKYIAVGAWGTQSQGQPEVLIFDRDAGSTPIASLDTPGSVMSVDISGDGEFVVVGTKSVHANTFGRGGEAYSLARGSQSFWIDGTPSYNRTVTLNTEGAIGDVIMLAIATDAIPGFAVPGIGGLLLIDASTMLPPFFLGVISSAAPLSTTVGVGGDASTIGLELYCQCLRNGGIPNFTNLLVLPITQ